MFKLMFAGTCFVALLTGCPEQSRYDGRVRVVERERERRPEGVGRERENGERRPEQREERSEDHKRP
jgi:hypothetical protein